LTDIFKQFDKNNDGLLSKDELIAGYTQIFKSVDRATIEVEHILAQVDMNNNGVVDYSEFLVANLQSNELLTNEKLQAAFNLFDIDGDGRITLEEIKSLLGTNLDMETNKDIWKELMAEGDDNDDGEISFEEFKTMMKKLLT